MSVNSTVRVPVSCSPLPGRSAAPDPSISAAPMKASAISGVTSMIRAAPNWCAAMWTACAASAVGAVHRQKTLPFFSFSQYLK